MSSIQHPSAWGALPEAVLVHLLSLCFWQLKHWLVQGQDTL